MSITKFLPKRTTSVAVLAVVIFVLGGIYLLRMESLVWHLWQPGFVGQPGAQDYRFGLHHYHVEVEARKVIDAKEELSGLTYNMERNTLVSVSSKHPLMIEMDTEGRELRRVRLDGAADIEGVAHVSGDRYIISNERAQTLVLVDWPEGIDQLDMHGAPQLRLDMEFASNKGIEGIEWDEKNNRLLITQERSPMRVWAIPDFLQKLQAGGTLTELDMTDMLQTVSAFSNMRDFSSLAFDAPSGHLLLLSDESRMVVELDPSGNIVGSLALWRGFHGLTKNIPQAEGLAIGPDRRIYVVSEPNLFYVFKPGHI
jgi:uncharacterized protein YjiK